MSPAKKPCRHVNPGWFVLMFAIIVAGGLGYCAMAFKNGIDPAKDTLLISGVSLFTALGSAMVKKFLGGDS